MARNHAQGSAEDHWWWRVERTYFEIGSATVQDRPSSYETARYIDAGEPVRMMQTSWESDTRTSVASSNLYNFNGQRETTAAMRQCAADILEATVCPDAPLRMPRLPADAVRQPGCLQARLALAAGELGPPKRVGTGCDC